MKILFYGASVTQQGGSSGYIQRLQELVTGSPFEISSLGYGACHFNDAGFYNLQKVISERPDVCVLEWNTTGLVEFDIKKMNSVLGRLIENNIYIAFLILPRRDTNMKGNRRAEELIMDISETLEIPLLDIRTSVDFEECVRDDVHTNNIGALLYANLIFNWLKITEFKKINKSFDVVRSVYVNDVNIFVREKSIIECDLKFHKSNFFEIVFETTVGPSMLNLLISIDAHQIERSFVDPWCYYERLMFHTVCQNEDLKFSSDFSKLLIRPSETLPDYSSLRQLPNIAANQEKGLLVHRIYSVGVELIDLRIKNG